MYDFIFYFFTSILLTYLLTCVLNIALEDKTVHTKKYQKIDFNLDNWLINEITKSDSEDENVAEDEKAADENVATGDKEFKRLMPYSPEPSSQRQKQNLIKNYKNNKTFNTGDIIKMSFTPTHYDSDDSVFEYRCPGRRSISTYGTEPLKPEEDVEYIITHIEKSGSIPNSKGASNLKKSFDNTDTFIYVYPKKQFDQMNGYFTDTHDIFWFINIDEMSVCQFEDAYQLENILQITKTGTLN